MKKSILGVALAVCCVSTANAQLHRRSSSFAGLKAGGTASSFLGNDANKNMRYIYGFNAGIFANLALAQPFSIQPELLYSMKGAQDAIGYSDATVWLTYIDVPVAFRATSTAGFFLEAGPQIGFLLSAKTDATGEKINVKSAYSNVDIGFVLGAGYQPTKGGLGIGGRYNGGFKTILKDPVDGTAARDVTNSAFQIYLTYSRPTTHKPKRKDK